jgi:hypothetical protein
LTPKQHINEEYGHADASAGVGSGDNDLCHARLVGIGVDVALADGQQARPLLQVSFWREELLPAALTLFLLILCHDD